MLMNSKYRKTIIAGNWKMNKSNQETRAFAEELKGAIPRIKRCSVVLCVPYPSISLAVKLLKDSRVSIAAQDVHWAEAGAYTGEVSASMLAELGVRYVIVGHSERRSYFGEDDFLVGKKLKAALEAGLRPILCVGESEMERACDLTHERIAYQVKAALSGISAEDMRHVVIAYEPIWAIGTGKTATPSEAGAVCAAIRSVVRHLYGARIARSTTIQYGGSMNEENAAALLAQPDVDGGLIGGASLKADHFLSIIAAANQE